MNAQKRSLWFIPIMAIIDTPSEPVIWRVHPARERVGTSCVIIGVVAVAMWAVVDLMENVWWALLPFLFFLVTLQRFFLPNVFRIDSDGISAGTPLSTQRIRWEDVRRFRHDAQGGFLSDRRRPSFRDGFRGVQLLFRDNREEIIGLIEAKLKARDAC